MSVLSDDLRFIYNHLTFPFSMLAQKRLFITGGTGFIGKWILEVINYANYYHNTNIKVTILSRNPQKFQRKYSQFSHFEFIKGDIINFSFPNATYDYIIHTATDASREEHKNNPSELLSVILDGTNRIIDFAIYCNAKRILFTSSGAIYGQHTKSEGKIKETQQYTEQYQKNAYAEGKRQSEELFIKHFSDHNNTEVVIARCFAFVGPYLPLDANFAIGNFINDFINNRKIHLTGDGAPYRSYLYAGDLVIWLLTILVKGKNQECYNVGSDQPITIKNLSNLIQNNKIETDLIVNSSSNYYVPDITKVKKELGLEVYTDLKKSIKSTIDFHLSK